jgi:hypothetical protein
VLIRCPVKGYQWLRVFRAVRKILQSSYRVSHVFSRPRAVDSGHNSIRLRHKELAGVPGYEQTTVSSGELANAVDKESGQFTNVNAKLDLDNRLPLAAVCHEAFVITKSSDSRSPLSCASIRTSRFAVTVMIHPYVWS